MQPLRSIRFFTLLLAVFLLFSSLALANEVLSAIDTGNYLIAKELFASKVLGNIYLEAEVFAGLNHRVEEAVENFNAGVWPYTQSSLVLECILRSEIITDDTVHLAQNLLENLSHSKEHYALGLAHLDDDQYFAALQEFALVIPEDQHYEDARRLYLQASEDFEAHYLKAAEEARDAEDYKSALASLDEAIFLSPRETFLEKRVEYEEDWANHALEVLEGVRYQFSQRLISLEDAEKFLWDLHADGHYDTDFIQRELIFLSRLKASQEAFDAGNQYLEQEDYLNAVEQYSQVSEDDFDYALAQERSEQALQGFRDYYTTSASLALENNDYGEAVQIIEGALSLRMDAALEWELERLLANWEEYDLEQLLSALDLFNRRLKSYQETQDFILAFQTQSILDTHVYEAALERLACFETSQRAFELGEEYFAKGRYLESIEQYKLVRQKDFYYDEATNKIALAEDEFVKSVGARMRTALAQNDYQEAFTTLGTALGSLDADGLYQLLAIAEEEEAQFFVTEKLRLAAEAFEPEGNYLAGSKIISQGLERFPDHGQLLDTLAFYQQFEPVRLGDLSTTVVENGDFWRNREQGEVDNTGRRHLPGSYVWPTFAKGKWVVSATYLLRGAYTDFTGTIAVTQGSRSNNRPVTVRVFGDGKLLLEQGNIRRGFLPVSFHLDLTNVQQLTIEYERMDSSEPTVIIGDAFLAKSYHGYPSALNYGELYYPKEPAPVESLEEQEYVDAVLQEADSVFQLNGDYAAAFNIIKEGQMEYSHNIRLAEAGAYYESFRPVFLLDLVDFYSVGSGLSLNAHTYFTDILGVSYRPNEYVYMYRGPSTVYAYYFGGKYTDFYGAITLDDVPSRPTRGVDYVRIFGDDRLLFEEKNTEEAFNHGEFHLDITGVEVLVLELGFDYHIHVMDFSKGGPILIKPYVVKSSTGFPYTGRK